MASPNTQRPSGVNVGVFNPGEIVYVNGNEVTDGSIRLIVDDTAENVEFQLREAGVWNVTGIQIAASSVFLGWSLKLSGAGEWIQTFESVSGDQALIPHVNYTDAGTEVVHSPVLGAKVIKNILQPDDSEEVSGKVLSLSVLGIDTTLLSKAYFRTGSIGGTAPVSIALRDGSASGQIFWQKQFPTSLFATPNIEITIELESLVETKAGETVFIEIASDEDISLKSNLAGFWWIASDFFPTSSIDISTINGNAVTFVDNMAGVLIPITAVDVWADIDDGGVGLIWDIAPGNENFTLTNSDNGEITYNGLVSCGIAASGSIEGASQAGKDGIEIGVSVNGADPTDVTRTRGLITSIQPDSVTIPTAKVLIEPGDTMKLQARNISDTSDIEIFQAKLSVL